LQNRREELAAKFLANAKKGKAGLWEKESRGDNHSSPRALEKEGFLSCRGVKASKAEFQRSTTDCCLKYLIP